jgi:hypothetical protein
MRLAKTGLVLIALCAVSCYATGDGTGALASAGAFEAASTYVSEAPTLRPTYVHSSSKRSESSDDSVSNKRQKCDNQKGKGRKKNTFEKPDNNFVALASGQ